MRVQRGSEGFRYGAPPDHERAVANVCRFLQGNGYEVTVPYRVLFYPLFVAKERLRYEFHEYDIAAWLLTHYHLNDRPDIIVEVDGERHFSGSKLVKINDGIARKFVQEYMPRCHFVRINKEDTPYDYYLQRQLLKDEEVST